MSLALIGNALIFCFVVCCIVSALLQILAWTRHAREGVRVDLRALWRPTGYFDDIGLRQMQLARRLLLIGGFAYIAFGGMMLVASMLG